MVLLGTDLDADIRTAAEKQHGVVTAAQARSAGLAAADVIARLRRDEWREPFRGVYLVSGGDEIMPSRALISAGLLAAGPDAVAIEETAAELGGLPTFGGAGMVHVAVPRAAARYSQEGLITRQVRLPADHRTRIDGLACTTALRTVADSVCYLPRPDAVSLVDAALHRGLIAPADLATVAEMIFRKPGCAGGRRYLAEADGRAGSLGETRLRLICQDADLTPDSLRYPVLDGDGTLLGHAALAWPAERLAAQIDEPLAAADTLTRAGWRVVRFTSADTPAYVVNVVRAALTARGGARDDSAADS